MILIGDCRETLPTLPAKHYHCAMTSPPYWGLRSYLPKDHADKSLEIGSEPTPEAFVATMVAVFREVRRVLRDDGVLFVNLGDSYASGWPCTRPNKVGNGSMPGGRIDREPRLAGAKEGDLCNMPHRVAAALAADGWYWRSTIIWSKRSPMPESISGWRWVRCRVKAGPSIRANGHKADAIPHKPHGGYADDGKSFASNAKWSPCPGCDKCLPHGGYVLRKGKWRPTTAHEYLFMFSKSERYFCDGDAVQELAVGGTPGNKTHKGAEAYANGDGHMRTKVGLVNMVASERRNPRSVWTLSNEPYKGAHFATFPTRLVKPCIEAATSKAGCCPTCGQCWAPVVESERVPTRPGEDCKILSAHANRTDIDPATNWQNSTLNYGNRDPQRHVARSRVTGYRPTCDCVEWYCNTCCCVIECNHENHGAPSPLRKLPITANGSPDESRAKVLQPQMLAEEKPDTARQGLQGLREDVSTAEPSQQVLLQGLRVPVDCEAPPEQPGVVQDNEGLHSGLHAEPQAGIEARICDAAPASDGAVAGPLAKAKRSRASQKRRQARQPAGQPGTNDEAQARSEAKDSPQRDRLPALQQADTSLKRCPKCQGDLVLRAPPPVACRVLDCFGGSGTVAQVARALGRDWTICELSEAYADLARERINTPPRWNTSKPKRKPRPVTPAQRDLFP